MGPAAYRGQDVLATYSGLAAYSGYMVAGGPAAYSGTTAYSGHMRAGGYIGGPAAYSGHEVLAMHDRRIYFVSIC